jgi:hypothetical protein
MYCGKRINPAQKQLPVDPPMPQNFLTPIVCLFFRVLISIKDVRGIKLLPVFGISLCPAQGADFEKYPMSIAASI